MLFLRHLAYPGEGFFVRTGEEITALI